MYKLVISDDEGKTIIVPLVRDLITVGRQDGNTIRLTERNVSRQHARLVKTESGYRIEDLESYNGVSINGGRISKAQDLKDGDRVGIGDYVIALKAEADMASETPPVPARPSAPSGVANSPPARLVMVSAPAPGAEFSIAKPLVRIGRLEELDLCISHRSISREHARVTQKEGAFEIEDLQSANGVRVNGSSVKRSTLRSGDVLELGQVRFRFVGPGEAYTFDPAEEEQVAAAPSRGLGPERRTVAAIVVTAAVVGGGLAWLGEGGRQAGAAGVTTPPAPVVAAKLPEPEPAAVEPNPQPEIDAQVSAALEGCRTSLAAENFDEALKAAQNGLVVKPSDSDLSACKLQADEALRAMSAYEQGKKALSENKLDDAYFLFAGIPDGSSYRLKPEVTQTMQRVAMGRLTQARKALKTNPAEARKLAGSVLDMYGLTTVMVDDANHIMTVSGRSAPVAAAAAPRPRTSAPAPTPAPEARAPEAATSEAESPAKLARNCLARGDQRCAVRALEGHAENSQELALLIETYRALGETKKAVRHMENFVARYPTARQAPQYRQFISKHDE
jgi:pSer/pThr/pTyr-binding forkhead associated (FHA) protein/tetratricopeptide (TPR) repeat protein